MTENPENDDGLGNFDLDQIGMQGGAFGGARILKFDTDHYVARGGEIIGPESEFIVLGLLKVIQKWVGGKQAAPPIIVPSGEHAPDVAEMNAKAPKEEWGSDPFSGNPVGPYSLILVLTLLNEATLDRLAFLSRSVGGAIGIGDLSDKIKFMRRLKGPDVVPVVSLRSAPWPIKRLNIIRKRPHFHPLRWIRLGDSGPKLPPPDPVKPLPAPATVIPPPQKPAPSPPPPPPPLPPAAETPPPSAAAAATIPAAEAPPTAIGTPVALETVSEPTLKEELRDEIIF